MAPGRGESPHASTRAQASAGASFFTISAAIVERGRGPTSWRRTGRTGLGLRCVVDTRRAALSLLIDRDHYERVTLAIAGARTSVWISTANVKQLMIEAPVGTRARARGSYVPILDTLQSLCDRGVH